jgi:hypothetical protein
MFATLAFQTALGVNAANTQVAAVNDPEFTSRNSNFMFSEDFNLLAAYYGAANATAARLNAPSINQIGRHHFWPVERSLTIPDTPGFQDNRDYPIPLPTEEEVGVEGSNNLGAATEQSYCVFWIAPPNWSRAITRGLQRAMIRATATITTVADNWSGDTALTLADNIRGGTYVVVGGQCQGANSIAWRLNFRNGNMYRSRKLRPGGLCANAIGNTPRWEFDMGFGEWGRFKSLELPAVQVLATASAAVAHEFRLNCIYLGDNAPIM